MRTRGPNTCYGKLRQNGRPEDGDLLSEERMTTSAVYGGLLITACSATTRKNWFRMVFEIIGELIDLDTKPKPESLWWMSTFEDEDHATLLLGKKGLTWDSHVQARQHQLAVECRNVDQSLCLGESHFTSYFWCGREENHVPPNAIDRWRTTRLGLTHQHSNHSHARALE